jgi:serine/threonine protein kinase
MTGGNEHVHFAVGDPANDDSHPKPPPSPPPPLMSGSLTPKFKSKDLRGNLMREQIDRDPLFYYEVVTVVGVGSMGSVAKVRKRDAAVGGSARKDLQDHFRREKQMKTCFNLPLVGGFFNFCLKGMVKAPTSPRDSERVSSSGRSSMGGGSRSSSILEPAYTNENIFAMKSIHLSRVTDQSFVEELKNEIKILRHLDHAHIVRAIETFEHRNQIFIVMELCSGGDLYSRDPYTEEEAARITSSILSAVAYMHYKGVIHRDLKYENILFVDNHPRAEIKLIDFGLSKRFAHEDLTEGVGTVYVFTCDDYDSLFPF